MQIYALSMSASNIFSLFGERHVILLAAPALARRVALFEVFTVYREARDNPVVHQNNPSPEGAVEP
jgi:hypothetical protein